MVGLCRLRLSSLFLLLLSCSGWFLLLGECQITSSQLNLTEAQLHCLNALSFDLCVTDLSLSCPPRFYLNQYTDPTYRIELFSYLLNDFMYKANKSAPWYLSQLLATGDSFSVYVDATYGTQCSTDTDVQNLLVNTTATQAEIGRVWWLDKLMMIEFCTENQIYVEGMGCICKEDKSCDETKTNQFEAVIRAMIFVMAVVLIITLARTYVFTRHGQSLRKEYLALMDTCGKIVVVLQSALAERYTTTTSVAATPSSQGIIINKSQTRKTSISDSPPMAQTTATLNNSSAGVRARRKLPSTGGTTVMASFTPPQVTTSSPLLQPTSQHKLSPTTTSTATPSDNRQASPPLSGVTTATPSSVPSVFEEFK